MVVHVPHGHTVAMFSSPIIHCKEGVFEPASSLRVVMETSQLNIRKQAKRTLGIYVQLGPIWPGH